MDFIPAVSLLMYHGQKAVLSAGRAALALRAFFALISGGRFYRIALELELPSFFRFVFTVAFLAGLVYAGIVALATFVTPVPHEIVQTVPPARLNQ
jgi:hypothetical protein